VPDRFRAEVCDLVRDEFPPSFAQSDLATLIFCLSAIAPEHHALVAAKIYKLMRPGGIFYFRDYGRYDHQQVNLARKGGRKLKDNFYEKGDGIRVYYFEEGEVARLFEVNQMIYGKQYSFNRENLQEKNG
jgi:SAM-dependent methyltransferase